MNKAENLRKITLTFQAGTTSDNMDLPLKHPEIEFIFGLAPEGMTPFEYELVDKTEGEEILLHLKKDDCNEFFEHLSSLFWDLFKERDELYLKAKIAAVADAENREIVRAMADRAAHGGGGCDCGCGCG
jgi:hypothetical protein